MAQIPDALLDRPVELTGPIEPTMIINALNSAAPRFMADFEGATGRSGPACVDTRNFGSAFRHSNDWIQKMSFRRFAFVLAVSAVLSAASAQASSNLDAAAIRSQQQQIRADAEARNGQYKDMPGSKRNDLFRRQGQVEGPLGNVQSTTELDETRRIQLFDHLEAISAIINADDDERMICKRSKPLGSMRPRRFAKPWPSVAMSVKRSSAKCFGATRDKIPGRVHAACASDRRSARR